MLACLPPKSVPLPSRGVGRREKVAHLEYCSFFL